MDMSSYKYEEPLNLILKAREDSVFLEYSKGKVSIEGFDPKRNTAIRSMLKEKRSEIAEFYKGLDSRLQKGQQWLVNVEKRMWNKDGPIKDRKKIDIVSKNIDLWDVLDSLIIPHHCPIGVRGCNENSPVICRTCSKSKVTV
jgi:hypothetical protein